MGYVMLSDAEIGGLMIRYQEQTDKAESASKVWEARKAWLESYIKANIANYQGVDARRRKIKGDEKLNDAMDRYNWHQREAGRLLGMIQMETVLRQLYPNNVISDAMRLQAEAMRNA